MNLSEMDIASLRDLFSGPGVDTRSWLEYGQVQPDSGDSHSVRFNDEDGNPLPQGVMVDVKLQPGGIILPCRVGGHLAGTGEAEYSPFGPGDEVLVAIPSGDERQGGVIISRLTNTYDTFPRQVAGQDVTLNNVTFKRLKTPYILETAASYLVRSALTGAQLAMDASGNLFFSDGEGSLLSISQSVITLQTPKGEALLQIDPVGFSVALQSNATSLVLDDANGSNFLSGNTLSIGTLGINPGQHAVTLEQVLGIIANTICMLGNTLAFDQLGPYASAAWSAGAPALLTAIFAGVIPGCVLPTPVGTGGLPGGLLDALGLAVLLPVALGQPDLHGPDKPIPVPAPFAPGLGRGGLFI
jgi:hypothetical protein